MTIYDSLAPVYEQVFPYDPVQGDFFMNTVPALGSGGSLLDIGCGTGAFARDMQSRGASVAALDFDAAMIEEAKTRSALVDFQQRDMHAVQAYYEKESFAAVSCLGNTLVHCSSLMETGELIASIASLLKNNGKAVFQILNYDYILDAGITELPLIEREGLRFERKYSAAGKLLRFETVIEYDNKRYAASTDLFPLRKHELAALCLRTDLGSVDFYSDFSLSPVTETSFSLVCIAEKIKDCHH